MRGCVGSWRRLFEATVGGGAETEEGVVLGDDVGLGGPRSTNLICTIAIRYRSLSFPLQPHQQSPNSPSVKQCTLLTTRPEPQHSHQLHAHHPLTSLTNRTSTPISHLQQKPYIPSPPQIPFPANPNTPTSKNNNKIQSSHIKLQSPQPY